MRRACDWEVGLDQVPAIASQYTDEQIDTQQVRMIVYHLARPERRCEEMLRNTVLRKAVP
jgi:hypothetical protein